MSGKKLDGQDGCEVSKSVDDMTDTSRPCVISHLNRETHCRAIMAFLSRNVLADAPLLNRASWI